jgi:hypothetical protein
MAGLFSLFLVWKIAKYLEFNFIQELLAFSLVAFLPGLLWVGQDARSYGLTGCVFLLAVWFLTNGKWLGFSAACGLLFYCHNTGALLAAGIFVVFYIYWAVPKLRIQQILIMLGILVVSALPVLFRILARNELASGPLQPWAPVLTPDWFVMSITQAFWAGSYQVSVIGFLTFSILLTSTLIFFHKINIVKPLLLQVWTYPLFIMVIVSLVYNNLFLYRTFSPLLYPICLWLGFVLGYKPLYLGRILLASGWLVVLGITLITWDPALRGGYLNNVALEIRDKFQPGDLIIYSTYTVAMPFDYYLRDLPHSNARLAANSFLNEPGDSIGLDLSELANYTRVWFISPEDGLIALDEREFINSLHATDPDPEYQVFYKQAATINVWLIDAGEFRSRLMVGNR